MTMQTNTKNEGLELEFGGEHFRALAERALWHPASRSLLLADLHLGKGNVFRRQGLAVPPGSTRHDLKRLSELLTAFQPEQLLILGDLVHAPPRSDEPWLQAFAEWRDTFNSTQVRLLAGNHDRALQRWCQRWRIDDSQAQLQLGEVVLQHEAQPGQGPQIAGHLHPSLLLRDRHDRVRISGFWQSPCRLILPAFGSFTGGADIELQSQERFLACIDGGLLPIDASARRT